MLPHLVRKLGGCSGILYSLHWPGQSDITVLSHLPHNKSSSLRRPCATQEVTMRKVPAGPVRCGREQRRVLFDRGHWVKENEGMIVYGGFEPNFSVRAWRRVERVHLLGGKQMGVRGAARPVVAEDVWRVEWIGLA